MRDYKNEKQDAEIFITAVVKRLSPSNKQRVADILMGMQLAEPVKTDAPLSYPQGGVTQCG